MALQNENCRCKPMKSIARNDNRRLVESEAKTFNEKFYPPQFQPKWMLEPVIDTCATGCIYISIYTLNIVFTYNKHNLFIFQGKVLGIEATTVIRSCGKTYDNSICSQADHTKVSLFGVKSEAWQCSCDEDSCNSSTNIAVALPLLLGKKIDLAWFLKLSAQDLGLA